MRPSGGGGGGSRDVPCLNFKPCHVGISEGCHVAVAISCNVGMLQSELCLIIRTKNHYNWPL